MVDVSLQEFFEVQSFNIDRIDSSKLDPRRATHKIKFLEAVEELIDSFQLEDKIDWFCHLSESNE